MGAKHRLGHVDFNNDLTTLPHSRDDIAFADAQSHMNMLPGHLIQSSFHDQRQWISISSVNHRFVHEWILDRSQQFLFLNTLQSVSLCSSDPLEAIIVSHDFVAFLLINFNDFVNEGNVSFLVFLL